MTIHRPDSSFTWAAPEDDNYDLYVKALGIATEPMRSTADPASDVSPVWSHDGREIALFCWSQHGKGVISRVASTGGWERKVLDLPPRIWYEAQLANPAWVAHLDVTWSPDRKWLAFSKRRTETEPYRIVRVSVETPEEEPLTSTPQDSLGDRRPEFSPDGSQIVFSRSASKFWGNWDVWVQPVSGGEARQLTNGLYANCWATWMPDGKELLATVEETQGLLRVLRLNLNEGEPLPVLGLGENASSPSVWGNRLVYVQETRLVENVWRIPARKATSSGREAEELIVSSFGHGAPAFSPDGQKIAFSSNRTGVYNIWTCNQDGSDAVQLTEFEAEATAPHWSPDGKQIVFDSIQAGNRDIYIVDADGGVPKQLTDNPSDDGEPSWSRDGKSIYFHSTRGGKRSDLENASRRRRGGSGY